MNQAGEQAGGRAGLIKRPEMVDGNLILDKLSDICGLIYKFRSQIPRKAKIFILICANRVTVAHSIENLNLRNGVNFCFNLLLL